MFRWKKFACLNFLISLDLLVSAVKSIDMLHGSARRGSRLEKLFVIRSDKNLAFFLVEILVFRTAFCINYRVIIIDWLDGALTRQYCVCCYLTFLRSACCSAGTADSASLQTTMARAATLLLLLGLLAASSFAKLKELTRSGDEIVVCGRFFHIGTPVVLWMDPGGYDQCDFCSQLPRAKRCCLATAIVSNCASLLGTSRHGQSARPWILRSKRQTDIICART